MNGMTSSSEEGRKFVGKDMMRHTYPAGASSSFRVIALLLIRSPGTLTSSTELGDISQRLISMDFITFGNLKLPSSNRFVSSVFFATFLQPGSTSSCSNIQSILRPNIFRWGACSPLIVRRLFMSAEVDVLTFSPVMQQTLDWSNAVSMNGQSRWTTNACWWRCCNNYKWTLRSTLSRDRP